MTVGSGARARSRQVLGLAVAIATASLLGFVLLGIVGRWLSKDANADFLSTWGLVFGLGSVIGLVEQEAARQATHADLAGRPAPASTLQLAALTGGVALLGLAVVALTPAGAALASGSLLVIGLVALAVVGFAGQFLSRGISLGRQRTTDYMALLVGEALVRVLVVLALVWAVPAGGTATLATAAVVAGCFAWLVVAPRLAGTVSWTEGPEPWRVTGRRIGTLALANALSALTLTGFPTLVTGVLGSSVGLADLFAAVTLSRIPLVAVSPLQALVVPATVRMMEQGQLAGLARFQAIGAAFAAVAAAILGAAGYFLGPWAMSVFLGARYATVPPLMLAALLATSAFMAVALLQAAAFIALERYGTLIGVWGAAVAAAVVLLLAVPGGAPAKGIAAFVGASLTAYVVSGVVLLLAVRPMRAPRST